jgi:hypothetical protein
MGVPADETRQYTPSRADKSSSKAPRIVYKPRPETTPDTEIRTLAAVYAYILEHYQQKHAVQGSPADTNTLEVERRDA